MYVGINAVATGTGDVCLKLLCLQPDCASSQCADKWNRVHLSYPGYKWSLDGELPCHSFQLLLYSGHSLLHDVLQPVYFWELLH